MIKRILVYTYGDQSHQNTINAAAQKAKELGAQVIGLYVKPDYRYYSNFYGEYPLNIAKTFYDRLETYSQDNKQVFEEAIKSAGVQGEWHQVDQYENGPKPEFYTDMLFASQPDPQSNTMFSEVDFVDALIMRTGVPIVIIPRGCDSVKFGERPLLGWKETKEASNAVRLSLPVMQQAKDVEILAVTKADSSDNELINGIQISEYLSLHDVKCHFVTETMNIDDINEADTLLRYAKAKGRDLLIVGGYSHTRFREIILGGVTRKLLRDSSIPVLFAH